MVIKMTFMNKKDFYCFEDTGRSGYAGGQRITDFLIARCKEFDLNINFTVFDRGHNKKLERNLILKKVKYKSFSKNKYPGLIRWGLICLKNAYFTRSKKLIIYTPTRISSFLLGIIFFIFKKNNIVWITHEHMVSHKNKIINFLYDLLSNKIDLQLFSSDYCKSTYKFNRSKSKEIFGKIVAEEIPEINKNDSLIEQKILSHKLKSKKNKVDFISVLYLGRINKEKGIFKLINIIKKEISTYEDKIDINFYIFGPGSQKQLSLLKRSIIKNKNIHYFGEADISKRFYSFFDIGIVPSWNYKESLGLSAFEMAFHMKKALISTKSKSFDDLYKINGIEKLRKNEIVQQIIDLYGQSKDKHFDYKKYNSQERIVINEIMKLSQ